MYVSVGGSSLLLAMHIERLFQDDVMNFPVRLVRTPFVACLEIYGVVTYRCCCFNVWKISFCRKYSTDIIVLLMLHLSFSGKRNLSVVVAW